MGLDTGYNHKFFFVLAAGKQVKKIVANKTQFNKPVHTPRNQSAILSTIVICVDVSMVPMALACRYPFAFNDCKH